mmetsp:Transcript_13253/g.29805  ORF Transcript_13253/g.29805 Transcript_13253/m.29805 type:complete len:150 (+) Transcript_13253:50-499(+)
MRIKGLTSFYTGRAHSRTGRVSSKSRATNEPYADYSSSSSNSTGRGSEEGIYEKPRSTIADANILGHDLHCFKCPHDKNSSSRSGGMSQAELDQLCVSSEPQPPSRLSQSRPRPLTGVVTFSTEQKVSFRDSCSWFHQRSHSKSPASFC